MTLSYPYDPTGSSLDNKIVDELHSVQAPTDGSKGNYSVPFASPFFAIGLEVYTQPKKGGTKLVEGVDYALIFNYVAGSTTLGTMIYGGILWINTNYTGNVYLTYNTLGGDHVINDVGTIQTLIRAQYANALRVTRFDELKAVPSSFPPTAHLHGVDDIKTFADVKVAIDSLTAALLAISGASGDSGALAVIKQHLANSKNAHSPDAVGLGEVSNYGIASLEDISNWVANKYLTPNGLRYGVNKLLADQDLDTLRTSLNAAQQAIELLKTSNTNLQNSINSKGTSIDELASKLELANKSIEGLASELQNVNLQISTSGAITAQINAAFAAVSHNVESVIQYVSQTVYAGNCTYPVGTHRVVLPAKNVLSITLIGAGGGSGAYYEDTHDYIRYGTPASDGEDTQLWLNGTANNPIEPRLALVAGGGKAGQSSYLNGVFAQGGSGGKSQTLGTRINLSDILGLSLVDDNSKTGFDGSSGQSNATEKAAAGMGGYAIDTTGNLSAKKFGVGRAGTTRAGLGGSGAKANIVIVNNLAVDYNLTIYVGAGGQTARGAFGVKDSQLNSNGVAYTLLTK